MHGLAIRKRNIIDKKNSSSSKQMIMIFYKNSNQSEMTYVIPSILLQK